MTASLSQPWTWRSCSCGEDTVFILSAPRAQADPSVLVYHDVADEYGNAVLKAIDELWPSSTPEVHTGTAEQSGFNAALSSGALDVITIECWNSDLNGRQ